MWVTVLHILFVCVCVCVIYKLHSLQMSVTVLSLCVVVCPLSTRRLEGLYYNLNISKGFMLIF
jgi:hypothetical protein